VDVVPTFIEMLLESKVPNILNMRELISMSRNALLIFIDIII
jgi:hypothetical protein